MTDTHPEPILPTKHAALKEDINSLGMWVFLTSELMFFGAMFTGYLVYRYLYPQVFAEASRYLDLTLGSINTAILLTSSFTMALAVNAAQRSLRRPLVAFLLVTILLAMIFLGIKGWEYLHKFEEGLFPGGLFTYPGEDPQNARLFFSLYFAMTGLHAAHMILGILVMGILALLSWRGRYSAGYHAPVEITGLYWHFVDIVWIFIFPLFYLIERT